MVKESVHKMVVFDGEKNLMQTVTMIGVVDAPSITE